MKKMRKLIAVVLALTVAMTMGIATTAVAFAAPATDCSISVTKNFKDQTYNLYQIFTAETVADRTGDQTDGISYKLMSGKTDLKATVGGTTVDGAQWFTIDTAGNISVNGSGPSLDDAAFKAWVEAYGVSKGAKTAASDNDANVKWENLQEGYYYITTTTGSLVTVDSVKPNANVEDKNTIPTVDKTITGASSISDQGKKALAQIGTDVEYTATVTIGKGSKNVKFHDTMDTGLDFKANSITVTGIEASDYEVLATPDQGDTFTIKFKDGLAEGTEITIKYKATINANALTKLENDAKVTYGDNNTSTEESKTEVYNAQISVLKFDGDKNANPPKYLPGAGFKLKNSDDKYYKLEGTVVSWVAKDQADEHTSGSDGKVPAFTGLANGTYTLEETTVPNGYNKAADTPITIAEGNYTAANLDQKAEIENNTGSELPSTGGIGTTIFYILGALLVIGCGIILIARRRMSANN